MLAVEERIQKLLAEIAALEAQAKRTNGDRLSVVEKAMEVALIALTTPADIRQLIEERLATVRKVKPGARTREADQFYAGQIYAYESLLEYLKRTPPPYEVPDDESYG